MLSFSAVSPRALRSRLALLATFFAVLFAWSPSASAETVYLKATGKSQGKIEGGVTTSGLKGLVRLRDVAHKLRTPHDAASGLASGRLGHNPVYIRTEVDRATPQFLSALESNELFSEFKIEFWRPDRAGKEEVSFTMQLVNARVTEVTLSTEEVQQRPSVRIGFTYDRIVWTWVPDGVAADTRWVAPVGSSAPRPSPKAGKSKAAAPRPQSRRTKKRSKPKVRSRSKK